MGTDPNQTSKWDIAIGEKIKQAREEAHLTQAQLANFIHKSQGNVSDFERGKLQINALDLFVIANAVDKPITFFVPHPPYGPTKEGDLTSKEQEFFHFIREIGDEQQANQILNMAITQAKQLLDYIIARDVQAYKEAVLADARGKPKSKPRK